MGFAWSGFGGGGPCPQGPPTPVQGQPRGHLSVLDSGSRRPQGEGAVRFACQAFHVMSSRPKAESPRGTRSSSAPAAPGGRASESALNLLEHCLCPGGRDRLLSGHLKWTSLCADTLPCPCERPLPIPSPHLLVHEGATRSPGHRGRGTPAVCGGCSRQVAPPSLPVSALCCFRLRSPIGALLAACGPPPAGLPTLWAPGQQAFCSLDSAPEGRGS